MVAFMESFTGKFSITSFDFDIVKILQLTLLFYSKKSISYVIKKEDLKEDGFEVWFSEQNAVSSWFIRKQDRHCGFCSQQQDNQKAFMVSKKES